MLMDPYKLQLLADVAKCTADHDHSKYPGTVSVCVEAGKAIATNGKHIVLADLPKVEPNQDRKFPPLEQVAPAGEPLDTIVIDARLLLKIARVLRHYRGDYECNQTRIEFRGYDRPLVFRTKDNDGEECVAVLCPIVTKEDRRKHESAKAKTAPDNGQPQTQPKRQMEHA